jgi:hypothetical protein
VSRLVLPHPHDQVVTKCCIPHVASCSISPSIYSSSAALEGSFCFPGDADADAHADASATGTGYRERGKLMLALTASYHGWAGQLASAFCLVWARPALPFRWNWALPLPARQRTPRPTPSVRDSRLVVPRWRWPRHVGSWVAELVISCSAPHRTALRCPAQF